MQPTGNNIKILNPRSLNDSVFLLEAGSLIVGDVEEVSADVKVPFKKGAVLYFYTGRQVYLKKDIFINIDMVVGYIPGNNSLSD